MPKIKLFRVSGCCCATATTAPTYSLNTHAPDQPTCRPRLLHWTFDLAAPGHRQCGKGTIDFHDFSRAPTDAQVELAQRESTPARSLCSACQLGKSESAEVSVFPQKFSIFCRKSKFSAENPKVPQNFSIFRRIRFNSCGAFRFSMEDLDLRLKFQIFRRTFSSSMELLIFPQNFAIFCRTFRSSVEDSDLPRKFRIFRGSFGFFAKLLKLPRKI